MNHKLFFHYLSYLQYPLLFGVLYFSYRMNSGKYNNSSLSDFNSLLVLMGLAVSFSTLQDTKKVSVSFEKKVWENPKYGKIAINLVIGLTFIILAFGIFGFFISTNEKIKEVSFGAIVLGIGFVGFTKTALEIFENHRKDTEN